MSNAPAWTRDKYNDTDSPAGAKYPFPSAPLAPYDIKEPPPYSNSDGFPLYKRDAKHGQVSCPTWKNQHTGASSDAQR